MQQVRAEVLDTDLKSFDYQFEIPRHEWDPELSSTDTLSVSGALEHAAQLQQTRRLVKVRASVAETLEGWKLVKGLRPRLGPIKERDQAALNLAAPESGSFILVSLARRSKNRARTFKGQ